MAGDAAGLRFTSAVAEGWLCSSSVGHEYAISGSSLQQNFVKIGEGRGTLQRFVSLNMGREGSGQGHRLERGLKNVCGEISVWCFTLCVCKVEIALDMFLHPGRVVLNFGMPPKLFSVYNVPVRYSACYLIDLPT